MCKKVLVLCKLSNHALYLYKVSWKYLKVFQSYSADTISYLNIFKEAPFRRKYRWSYDPCSQHFFLIMLYICTKCHENISKGFRVMKGLDFQYSIFSIQNFQRGIIP